MSEPIEWLCRVLGFVAAFAGATGAIFLTPTLFNEKIEGDEPKF